MNCYFNLQNMLLKCTLFEEFEAYVETFEYQIRISSRLSNGMNNRNDRFLMLDSLNSSDKGKLEGAKIISKQE